MSAGSIISLGGSSEKAEHLAKIRRHQEDALLRVAEIQRQVESKSQSLRAQRSRLAREAATLKEGSLQHQYLGQLTDIPSSTSLGALDSTHDPAGSFEAPSTWSSVPLSRVYDPRRAEALLPQFEPSPLTSPPEAANWEQLQQEADGLEDRLAAAESAALARVRSLVTEGSRSVLQVTQQGMLEAQRWESEARQNALGSLRELAVAEEESICRRIQELATREQELLEETQRRARAVLREELRREGASVLALLRPQLESVGAEVLEEVKSLQKKVKLHEERVEEWIAEETRKRLADQATMAAWIASKGAQVAEVTADALAELAAASERACRAAQESCEVLERYREELPKIDESAVAEQLALAEAACQEATERTLKAEAAEQQAMEEARTYHDLLLKAEQEHCRQCSEAMADGHALALPLPEEQEELEVPKLEDGAVLAEAALSQVEELPEKAAPQAKEQEDHPVVEGPGTKASSRSLERQLSEERRVALLGRHRAGCAEGPEGSPPRPLQAKIPASYQMAVAAVEQHGWQEIYGCGQEWTVLHWAALEGHTDVCAKLLRARADPHQADHGGKTALDRAREAGRMETYDLLASAHRLRDWAPSEPLPMLSTDLS